MSTTTLPTEAHLTPQQSLLTDEIGNEVYSSHYAERKMSRFVIGAESLALLAAMALIFSLAHRPIANRYIRIDEMGRAQAIAYTDLNYSPREGEVRTYLTDWANYRYTLSRDTIAKKYPLNYYFLSQNLASQLMATDNQSHLVSQVVGGQVEQSDVEVKNVTITTTSEETVQGATIARGTALMTIDKLYSQRNSREPRTEHWILSVTYYLNPKQVSDAAFIHAGADDVVEQALAYVFSKDRDFQDFLKTPQAERVTSTLRIRKAPVAEVAAPVVQKPATAASSASSSQAKGA